MSRLDPHGAAFTSVVLEVFQLNRVLLDAGDELTSAVGLTSARWQVLGVVEHGPVPVSYVARNMGLTRQSVQETANALAADGFVDFVDNPQHRRSRLMVLTPRGREAMERLARLHAEWANAVGQGRSLEALRAAAAELGGLRRAVDRDASRNP